MKKIVSLVLACLIFWQCLPLNALAASYTPLTPGEVEDAVALTGLADDAPTYHEGMDVTDAMNTMQMVGWLAEYEDESAGYLMDIFENYNVALEEFWGDPALDGYGDAIEYFYLAYDVQREHKDTVSYCRHVLTDTASDIFTLAESLAEDDLSEKEEAVCLYEIGESYDMMVDIRDDVIMNYPGWSDGFAPWEELKKVDSSLADIDIYGLITDLFDVLDELADSEGRAIARSMTVPASALRVAPDQTLMTRLNRLSPISGALADEDRTMKIMVLDDKYFAICVFEDGKPLQGVEVKVQGKDQAQKTGVTAEGGFAAFAVRDFKTGDDGVGSIDVTLTKKGYRRVFAPGLWFKKGQKVNLQMVKDSGKPYPVSWTFWGNDMLTADYSVVRNDQNDSEQEIAVRITSGKSYSFKMYFQDRNGVNGPTVGTGNGHAGETDFSFKGQWLKMVKADSTLHLVITSDGETIRHKARLVVKPSKTPFPFGAPNLNPMTKLGLHFALPKDWAKPFGGLSIDIVPPFAEKFPIRAFVDILGNGLLSVGTTLLDDKLKKVNDGLWKTQDQRTLDRSVKNVEEQGRLAKAKAANGGDWAGRKKWNPLKLGKISLDMSWFGFLQVQYRATRGDEGDIYGRGSLGFTASVNGEAGLQWPFVNITLGASLSATVFPEVGVKFGAVWPKANKLPSLTSFDYVRGAMNLILRVELSLTLSLGLKGIASVSIGGLGFLEFHFRQARNMATLEQFFNGQDAVSGKSGGEGDLTIYGGASFYVILEILWVKTKLFPFGQFKWKLYPGPIVQAQSRPETLTDRFIAFLLSSAKADDLDILEKKIQSDMQGQSSRQVQEANPDLDLKKYHAISGQTPTTGSSISSYSDRLEAFKMYPSSTTKESFPEQQDLVLQVRRQNASAHDVLMYSPVGAKGSTLNFIELASKYPDGTEPKDFDVIDFSYWVQNETNNPIETVDGSGSQTYFVKDLLFIAAILAKRGEANRQTVTVQDEGKTMETQIPKDTWLSVSCYALISGENGQVTLEPYRFRHPSDSSIHIVLNRCEKLEMATLANNPNGNPLIYGRVFEGGDPLSITKCEAQVVTTSLNPNPTGTAASRALVTRVGVDLPSMTPSTDSGITPDPLYEAFGKNIQVTQNAFFPIEVSAASLPARAALYHAAGDNSGNHTLVYVPASGDPVRLADKVLSMAVAEETGAGVPHTVYFVQEADGGNGYSLKSAELYTDKSGNVTKITITDYDVQMPAAEIQYAKLYGEGCLYWPEKVGTEDSEKKSERNEFIVRGLWVEKNTSTSLPFELGRIPIEEKGGSLTSLSLAGDDKGFYTIEIDPGEGEKAGSLNVYRFSFKITLGVKLIGNVLEETLVAPGSYDNMALTYYNNGNVPLTGMDLGVYRKTEGGRKIEKFEIIHLDFLQPDRNTITLRQGLSGAKQVRTGLTLAHPEDSSLGQELNQYRYITITECTVGGDHIARPNPATANKTLMKPQVTLPGSYGAYNISLLIPQGWSGEQEIYLRAERLYTALSSNFLKPVDESGSTITDTDRILSVGVNHRKRIIVGTKANPLPIPDPPPQDEYDEFEDEDFEYTQPSEEGQLPNPDPPPRDEYDRPVDEVFPDNQPSEEGQLPNPDPPPRDEYDRPVDEVFPDNRPTEDFFMPTEDGKQADTDDSGTLYVDMIETTIVFSFVELYIDMDDLEISSELWNDGDEEMVTLVVNNRAHIPPGRRRSNVVTIEARPQWEETPVFRYSLPEEISDKATWSMDVPLKDLTGGKKVTDLFISVNGKDYVENGEFDNYTVLYLDADPLFLVKNPADQKVPQGGTATFRVVAGGGRKPYYYQWQEKTPRGTWEDIEEAWDDTLVLENVTLAMNGNRYRCIVTDVDEYSVTSRGALLTVYPVPRTGDEAPVTGWIIGAVLSAAGLAIVIAILLRRRKEQDE